MTHIGDALGYQVYKNDQGFLEGYKKIGKKWVNGAELGTDCKRIVTNQKTMDGFMKYVQGLRSRLTPKPLKASELPSLFDVNTQ
jgi:hypothetical protein